MPTELYHHARASAVGLAERNDQDWLKKIWLKMLFLWWYIDFAELAGTSLAGGSS